MTQIQEILDYMLNNGGITSLKANNSIGCLRLSARIKDLEELGVVIDKKDVEVRKRYGGKTTVTEYSVNKKTKTETIDYIFGHKKYRRWKCPTES